MGPGPDEVVIFTVMIRDVEGRGEVQLQLDEIWDKAPEITISITVQNDSPVGINWIEFGRFEASGNLPQTCSTRHIQICSDN